MGAQVRCHTLLWHQQVPSWVQSLSKTEMLSALENHITEVMTHFGDSCYAWDVANEVMGDDATYRKSFWYTTTGTDYIVDRVKKSLGLKTKLYYNDYNTNTVNAKSTAVLKMIQTLLLDADIGIDGVGFQSHSSYSDTATTEDKVTNLERFTALGLDVAYTELDVKTSSTTPSEDEQKQVTVYTNTVASCQQVEDCVGVTIWDVDDTYTWLENAAPLPWYQPGGKGTELVRKRAYDGIAAGWGTSTASTTSTASSAAQTTSTSASVGGEAETEIRAASTENSAETETSTAASGSTETSTTSSAAGASSTQSSNTDTTASTAASGTESSTSSSTGAETTSTESSGYTSATSSGYTSTSSSGDAETTSSSNTETPTQSSSTGNTETTSTAGSSAQIPATKKSSCASRLRK
ncbi:family 10 glycoside hydrolase [Phytophthora sojae]|uniref:endo-1,4-beta-xylanase n=1 Tax=Phytophthora sojae (strain P6497) TaxID=1094619 RepID=G5A8P6_PHYSP|nr:family 10 glycoside hydrolase [Phytophthora sojae]EGZ08272.1 family 10 glycoside hydrolase [Phytophthora sojae]|eukprot:XP_009536444.1 family 10 glycoside hydrolase [Phytophthora sojae]